MRNIEVLDDIATCSLKESFITIVFLRQEKSKDLLRYISLEHK